MYMYIYVCTYIVARNHYSYKAVKAMNEENDEHSLLLHIDVFLF